VNIWGYANPAVTTKSQANVPVPDTIGTSHPHSPGGGSPGVRLVPLMTILDLAWGCDIGR
jgi:hypothetical protein